MMGFKPSPIQSQQQHNNAQQQDLLTSNPVLPQAGPWIKQPVTTSNSPAASGMLTASATAVAATAGGSGSAQNWINSRPNSSSIHSPSPTSAPLGAPPPQPLLTGGLLPPPLAPTTTHQPPSSIPPPAYTPPTQQHLSNTGFQTLPHSSS